MIKVKNLVVDTAAFIANAPLQVIMIKSTNKTLN